MILSMKAVSDASASAEIRQLLIGLQLTNVVRAEFSWRFIFDSGKSVLNTECPWRIVTDGHIAHGRDDHEQMFGLPAPVDGVGRSMRILSSLLVTSVQLSVGTGDLRVEFEGNRYLELFNSSAGHEGWSLSKSNDPSFCLVAMGGGQITIAK